MMIAESPRRSRAFVLCALLFAACYSTRPIGDDANPRATSEAIRVVQAGHGAGDPQVAEGARRAGEPVGPDVELGPQPSEDMIVVPGLEEPLVRMRTTTPEEDAAVKRALREFRRLSLSPSQIEDVIPPLEQFVADHPHSGWTAAVLLNLGLGYYRTGFFSRAFAAWDAAWQDGRDAKELRAKALVDRAVGELARMHARVGHADELEALFEDIGDRPMMGPATELMTGAREGAWEMRNDPGNAFLCGPKALGNTLRAMGISREATAFTDAARSGRHGFTLAEVAQLADQSGMPYRLVYRKPGQPIPVPSVINWKVEHFASIVAEENGRYHIVDPTFGGDLLISREAIDAEASGYFLVPSGVHQDPGWRDATVEEALSVRGMGTTSTSKPGAVTGDDTKIGGDDGSGGISDGAGGTGGSGGRCGKSIGMCAPDAHAMAVSLNLTDTPVGYAPQRGPSAFVRFTFNQREDGQPAVIPFGNVSPKWTLNILSYVQDDPANPGVNVTRYVPGGGTRSYTGYNASTGRFAPAMQTGEILERSPKTGPATGYTLTAPDGSQLIYSKSDNSGAMPRRMFLSTIKDPQGEAINLAYNTTYPSSPRLSAITDAGGRVTTFTYGIPECPLVISRITDPYGRYAQLAYHYQIGSSGSCTNLGAM